MQHIAITIILFSLVLGTSQMQSSEAIAYQPPPLKQISNGVEPTNVTCTEGLSLVLKVTSGSPACIKPSSVAKLIERGWAAHVLPNVESKEIQNSQTMQDGDYQVESSLVNYDEHSGFLAKPISEESFPGVVLIHE